MINLSPFTFSSLFAAMRDKQRDGHVHCESHRERDIAVSWCISSLRCRVALAYITPIAVTYFVRRWGPFDCVNVCVWMPHTHMQCFLQMLAIFFSLPLSPFLYVPHAVHVPLDVVIVNVKKNQFQGRKIYVNVERASWREGQRRVETHRGGETSRDVNSISNAKWIFSSLTTSTTENWQIIRENKLRLTSSHRHHHHYHRASFIHRFVALVAKACFFTTPLE